MHVCVWGGGINSIITCLFPVSPQHLVQELVSLDSAFKLPFQRSFQGGSIEPPTMYCNRDKNLRRRGDRAGGGFLARWERGGGKKTTCF